MADQYLNLLVTPAVATEQKRYYGQAMSTPSIRERDTLTADEQEFITSRDSFYLGTISESGWPYIQHRGGHPGFLQVLNPTLLAFADFRGNRQLLSTGNLAGNDRVSLFLMDYPQRTRLKILGHARVEEARLHPDLLERLAQAEEQRLVERIFLIDVVSFDWNCPKHITPRYTPAEIEEAVTPLHQRIAELEKQLQQNNQP